MALLDVLQSSGKSTCFTFSIDNELRNAEDNAELDLLMSERLLLPRGIDVCVLL